MICFVFESIRFHCRHLHCIDELNFHVGRDRRKVRSIVERMFCQFPHIVDSVLLDYQPYLSDDFLSFTFRYFSARCEIVWKKIYGNALPTRKKNEFTQTLILVNCSDENREYSRIFVKLFFLSSFFMARNTKKMVSYLFDFVYVQCRIKNRT